MIDTVDQIWAMKETTGVEAIIEVEVEVEKVSRMLEINSHSLYRYYLDFNSYRFFS